jgi:hypothetical protein
MNPHKARLIFEDIKKRGLKTVSDGLTGIDSAISEKLQIPSIKDILYIYKENCQHL